MADTFSLIFFFGLMLIAVVGFVFSILVYKQTKGAIVAWKYLAIYGCANAILGILGLVRNFSTGWFLDFVFTLQGFCIIVIFTFAVLSATSFVKDLGLGQSFLSGRNILIFIGILFTGLVLYNINNLILMWAQTFYSIAILCLTIAYSIILIPMGKLSFKTKKVQWFLLLLGWFFNALLIFSLLAGSCCNVNDLIAGDRGPGCTNDIVFVNILPLGCNMGISSLYQGGLLMVLVGSVFIVTSMGLFLYKLKRAR